MGYTPDLVAGVWIGNDNNTGLGGMGGGQTPAEIWRAFMLKAHKDIPVKEFEMSYVGGGIGELENDSKTSTHQPQNRRRDNNNGADRSDQATSNHQSAESNGATNAQRRNDNYDDNYDDNRSGANDGRDYRAIETSPPPSAPAATPAPAAPAAPPATPAEVPSMDDSVGKGRN